MQILLISANREQTPNPVAPLGLAYVAAPLIKDSHNVEALDLCFVDDVNASLRNTLERFAPDVIGLSIRNVDNLTYPKTISYLADIKNIIDLLKTLADVPIILGGSGFSLFPEETLRYFGLKMGIVGNGETAFKELVGKLNRKEDVYNTPNLAYIKEDCFSQNPVNITKDFSIPNRDILDNERYLKLGGMANIQTKRGCPFKCVYCTYPLLNGDHIRCRDPEDVLDELEEMVERRSIDYVFFVDDIFNHPLEHAYGICEGIIKRAIRISWTCFATPAGMTLDLAKLMKEAGCGGVEFGTDAASPQSLVNLGKMFIMEDIEKAAIFCEKAGLEAAHYLVLGGPGETVDTLKETFTFMETINPKAVIAMTGVRIYPNTGLMDISIKEGVIDEEDDLLEPHFYISPMLREKELLSKVGEYAASKDNWIVPGLDIRSSTELFDLLRRFRGRGPLWNMLGEGTSGFMVQGL